MQLAVHLDKVLLLHDFVKAHLCTVPLLLDLRYVFAGLLVVEEHLLELLREVFGLLRHTFQVVDHACLNWHLVGSRGCKGRGVDSFDLCVLDSGVDSIPLLLIFLLLVHVLHHRLVGLQRRIALLRLVPLLLRQLLEPLLGLRLFSLLLLLVDLRLGLGVGVETPWDRLGLLLFLGRLETDLDVLPPQVFVVGLLLLLEGTGA